MTPVTNASDPRDTVLVGAGGLGKKIGAALRTDLVAYADNDHAKHDYHATIPTLSVKDAVTRYPDARYVVSIWGGNSAHRIKDTEAALRSMGVWRVIPFGIVMRDLGLSHYWIASPDKFSDEMPAMLAGAELWHDSDSKRLYDLNVIARLGAIPTVLPEPIDGPAYWRSELVKFDGNDVILDGGAFVGDSLISYLDAAIYAKTLPRHFGRWIAVEPDRVNYEKMIENVEGYGGYPVDSFHPIHGALGTVPGSTQIEVTGTVDSRTGHSGATVPVFTIDSLLPAEKLSIIKLDIEGDEMAALNGGWERIARDRPTLAISVYHKPCDLWQIPLAIKEHCPDYRFYLRAHDAQGYDTTCYAVPPEKCV